MRQNTNATLDFVTFLSIAFEKIKTTIFWLFVCLSVCFLFLCLFDCVVVHPGQLFSAVRSYGLWLFKHISHVMLLNHFDIWYIRS